MSPCIFSLTTVLPSMKVPPQGIPIYTILLCEGTITVKNWLLYVASALFIFSLGQQRAFADCTDEFDLNGTDCSASKLCGKPCSSSSFVGGDLSKRLPIQKRTPPVTVARRTTPSSSTRISIISLSLLLLTVSLTTIRSIRQFDPHVTFNEERGRS